MCGLVGCAGIIVKKEVDTFNNLLVFSSVRGPHSTGAAIITEDYNINLIKKVGNPYELLDSKLYDTAISSVCKRVLLGHNRWATVGAVNSRNAHPFAFETIVGVHNGTLTPSSKSAMHNHKLYETDSEAIYSNIQHEGIKKTVEKLNGAYALVWFNKETNEIYMLRNKERTLFYAFNDKKDVLYWCSEPGILEAALERNGVDYKNITELKEDHLTAWAVPWKYNEYFNGWSVREKAVPSTKETYYNYNSNKWFGRKEQEPEKSSNVTILPDLRDKKKGKGNITFKGYKGNPLSVAALEGILSEGCAWCNSDISTTDKFRFVGDKDVLCKTCMSNEEILAMVGVEVEKETTDTLPVIIN